MRSERIKLRMMLSCFIALLIPYSLIDSSAPTFLWISLTALLLFTQSSIVAFNRPTIFLLGCMALMMLPSLFSSVLPYEGLERWSVFLILFVLTLVFSTSRETFRSDAFWSGMLWVNVAMISWGLIEWVWSMREGLLTHQATYQVTAAFSHRNLFILYVLSIAPLLIFRKYAGVHRYGQLIFSVALVWLGVGLLNRTAWVLLVLIAVFWVAQYPHRITNRLRTHWQLITLTLVGIGVMLLMLDEWYTVVHHVESIASMEGTTGDRLKLMAHSFQIAADMPWFGAGLGTWAIHQFDFVQTGMTTNAGTAFYLHPHNDYLWLASEAGWVVAGLYFGLHLLAVFKSVAMIKSGPGLSLAWGGVILTSFVDAPSTQPAFILLQALLICLTFSGKEVDFHKGAKWSIAPIVSLLVIFSLIRLVDLQQRKSSSVVGTEARFHVVSFDESALLPRYWQSIAAWDSGEKELACGWMEKEPKPEIYHPWEWWHYGRCALSAHDTNNAKQYFDRSVWSTTSFQRGWVALAQLSHAQCDWREAFRHLVRADVVHESESYDVLATELAMDSLTQLADQVEHRKMELTLLAIRNTPEWSLKVMKHAAMNQLDFSEQAYLDASYYMIDHCDTYADCDLVQEIVSHYLPHRIEALNKRLNAH